VQLNGKAGIIVGAANGIGRAAVELFHAEGAKLLLVDFDGDGAMALATHLSPDKTRARAFTADVTSGAQMQAAAQAAVEAYGRIDFLCHVAGIYPNRMIADMTEAFWDRTVDVNLKGVFLSIQACLPAMRAQHAGRIAVVSSVTGPRVALGGLSAYAAAKAGVCGFMRAAAIELAPHGVSINAVLPGTIATETLFRELGASDDLSSVAGETPAGRLGKPADIANALLFLVSESAAYITGQELVVDGGAIIRE
jgi:3-oxoacyl-[acyl-carrier protein] reductase